MSGSTACIQVYFVTGGKGPFDYFILKDGLTRLGSRRRCRASIIVFTRNSEALSR